MYKLNIVSEKSSFLENELLGTYSLFFESDVDEKEYWRNTVHSKELELRESWRIDGIMYSDDVFRKLLRTMRLHQFWVWYSMDSHKTSAKCYAPGILLMLAKKIADSVLEKTNLKDVYYTSELIELEEHS